MGFSVSKAIFLVITYMTTFNSSLGLPAGKINTKISQNINKQDFISDLEQYLTLNDNGMLQDRLKRQSGVQLDVDFIQTLKAALGSNEPLMRYVGDVVDKSENLFKIWCDKYACKKLLFESRQCQDLDQHEKYQHCENHAAGSVYPTLPQVISKDTLIQNYLTGDFRNGIEKLFNILLSNMTTYEHLIRIYNAVEPCEFRPSCDDLTRSLVDDGCNNFYNKEDSQFYFFCRSEGTVKDVKSTREVVKELMAILKLSYIASPVLQIPNLTLQYDKGDFHLAAIYTLRNQMKENQEALQTLRYFVQNPSLNFSDGPQFAL